MNWLDFKRLSTGLEAQQSTEQWDRETYFAQTSRPLTEYDLYLAGIIAVSGMFVGVCVGFIVIAIADAAGIWLDEHTTMGGCAAGGGGLALWSYTRRVLGLLAPSIEERERERQHDESGDVRAQHQQASATVRPVIVEWHDVQDGYPQMRRYDLGFDTNRLKRIAIHTLLNGNGFTQRELAHIVGSNEYKELRGRLLEAGLLREIDNRGAVEWTGAGRGIMRKVLALPPGN